jgi:hypothetical protein
MAGRIKQFDRSSDESIDGQLARRQEGITDTIYQVSGTWVVRRLTELGLAQSDSEVVARRYAADAAECAMATLKTEAARQSISVDELLSRVAAAGRNGGDPWDAVDRSSMEANAFPCEVHALQRAGIPLDELERLRECVEQTTSDANVSNVAAAIELCARNGIGDATRPRAPSVANWPISSAAHGPRWRATSEQHLFESSRSSGGSL